MKITVYIPKYGHATGHKPHYRPSTKYSVPQNLISLSTAVRRLRHRLVAVDGNVHHDPIQQIIRSDPDMVLLSSTTPSFQDAIETVRSLRQLGYTGKVYAGGSHVSLNLGVRDFLLPTSYDIHYIRTQNSRSVLAWVSELFGPEAVDRLFDETSPDHDGCPLEGCDVLFPRFLPDLSLIKEIYNPDSAWTSNGKVICPTMITSVGCSHDCLFCGNNYMYSQSYSQPWVVARMAETLAQIRAPGVSIHDMYFLMKPKHAQYVMSCLQDHRLRFGMQTCMESISEAVLDDLKVAGCDAFLVGVENPASYTLDKAVNLRQVSWLLGEAVAKRGIWVLLSYVFGLPGVDERDDFMLLEHIERDVLGTGYSSAFLQCNLFTPYRALSTVEYIPYDPSAPTRGSTESILTSIPFSWWGSFPVSFSGATSNFVHRMVLSDLIANRVYPEFLDVYHGLRSEYVSQLASNYPDLSSNLLSQEEAVDRYETFLRRRDAARGPDPSGSRWSGF
jgi:hypothetical protein